MRKTFGAKLSRERAQRIALLRALACALVQREKMETTTTKAKEVSRLVERLITKAKNKDHKTLNSFLGARLAKKLVDVIAPKFKDRKGGYTRISKLGVARSTGAPMAIVEFV
ncbi:MAG: LSU ribosomal protein L17P [Parcubacteria group bacterium Greene0714_21]|nr:MAG: LSU ribosomal protein L17P [Parcubacteria group bacterium Greene0416_39]TSC97731.1 MAG: LSU ribosomal protein L17P [Parcubacteria group bacterium Greene1014_47]TSD04346.1 MAG: LSU ribosomal protein L17P [Parcubacteria group bacterium Greene0714_21]